jgi:hypothetical protein
LELECIIGEVTEPGVAHELLEGDPEVVGQLVAGEVHEVDGAGVVERAHGGVEDEHDREEQHGDEVVLEVAVTENRVRGSSGDAGTSEWRMGWGARQKLP